MPARFEVDFIAPQGSVFIQVYDVPDSPRAMMLTVPEFNDLVSKVQQVTTGMRGRTGHTIRADQMKVGDIWAGMTIQKVEPQLSIPPLIPARIKLTFSDMSEVFLANGRNVNIERPV